MPIKKYPIDSGLISTFGGRAPGMARTRGVVLPSAEADANADTFVCEFTGGPSEHEAGVGLGLAGADLVLTQSGGIAASSGGYRALDGTDDLFTCTATMAASFLNQAEWTYALKLKSLTVTPGKFFVNMFDGTAAQMLLGIGDASGVLNGRIGRQARILSTNTVVNNSATAWWLCIWFKAGVYHIGWVQQDNIPTGWDSFPTGQRACAGGGVANSVTWTTLNIVSSAAAPPAMSVGVLVCSKIGLAAAPV